MSKTKMARGSGFSKEEMFALLDSIGEIVPIGMDEWAAIERRHGVSFPGQKRTKESLCQKFQTLYLVKKSTGDPTCPPEVRRAKELQQAIREKAEIFSAGSESLAEGPIDEEQNLSEEQQKNGVGGKDADTEPSSLSERNMPTTICTPISQRGSKRKKRDDDDGDDFSMKHMICFSMIQQQQTRDEHCADRQMMMQMMTMTIMQMQMMHANGATQNNTINERFNEMMGNLASQVLVHLVEQNKWVTMTIKIAMINRK